MKKNENESFWQCMIMWMFQFTARGEWECECKEELLVQQNLN